MDPDIALIIRLNSVFIPEASSNGRGGLGCRALPEDSSDRSDCKWRLQIDPSYYVLLLLLSYTWIDYLVPPRLSFRPCNSCSTLILDHSGCATGCGALFYSK